MRTDDKKKKKRREERRSKQENDITGRIRKNLLRSK